MKKIFSAGSFNYLALFSLVLAASFFFYFETSWILRIGVILLFGFSLFRFRSLPEVLTTFTLYLGFFDLYNIRYGLAIPIALILIAGFLLSIILFYFQMDVQKVIGELEKREFFTYLLIIGLTSIEVFLAMTVWPVDPKTKSLVIAVIFYLYSRLIYLEAHRVLNLKQAYGFVLSGAIVLGLVIGLSIYLGI